MPVLRRDADAGLSPVAQSTHAFIDIQPFLESLISVAGLSGYERPVLELIRDQWKPLADEISVSRLGSLQALKRGEGGGRRPAVMIATHMDAIGLIVTTITDDVLHFDDVGGVDPRILPGTPVIVHGKRKLPGVVAVPPLRTLPESEREGALGLPRLIVDVGLPTSQVAKLVEVGDLISFDTRPVHLAGETLGGHSLDNRASVAALTVCLMELKSKRHHWDVWAVATSQEEETYGGAATSAFGIDPDLAVVVDVSFGKGPGASSWETVPFGKGPAIGVGPHAHPFLRRRLKELSEKLDIPTSEELSPADAGTDAMMIQVAREGIPTAGLGIPVRYMHSPMELVSIKDVQRAGRLLSEFITMLDADFLGKMTWEGLDAD